MPNLRFHVGAYYWVRAQISGGDSTTIRIRVWQGGQTEPSAWHLTVKDDDATLVDAGQVGLRAYLSRRATNSAAAITFDDYHVVRLF